MTEPNVNPDNNPEEISEVEQQEHLEAASDFIANTSLDKMLEISQARFLKPPEDENALPEWFKEFQEPPEIPSFGSSNNS
ncbi:MAG: hypothetical protein AAF685_08350 [Cyanobacteria bacterium P01_C01_bin.89]